MKTYYTLFFLSCYTAVLACPECELVPMEYANYYTTDDTYDNCVNIEFSCGGSDCPEGIMPYENCLEDKELCVDITFETGLFSDCSLLNIADNLTGIDVNIKISGLYEKSIPLILTSNDPYSFCIPFNEVFNSETYGYAFSNPTAVPLVIIEVFRFGYGEGVSTGMNVIPPDGAVLGELVVENQEGYKKSENPIENLCQEGSTYSVNMGTEFSISSQGGWTFGLGNEIVTGSFGMNWSESYSGHINSTYTYTISEEDCESVESNCLCCFDIYPVARFRYNQYESITYDCEGNSSQGGNVIVATHNYQPTFIAEPVESCPPPVKMEPLKLFDNGNFMASTTGSITISEELDFDFYTLTWTGPNGFTAINETTLTDLPFGTYCYTLTHCGCEGPVDQGCVALCPGAMPASGWYYDENQELYCRNMSCDETGGAVQECVDGAPCSDWRYDEESESCFQDICYEGETLLVNGVPPQYVSYQYNEHSQMCETVVLCEEGGAELTLEKEPEYSEPFFDEFESTCLRYVICNGEEVNTENVGINDIEWGYDDLSGCIGTVACNEGSGFEGEVSGYDVSTDFEDWEYDTFNDCFRDVTCSYDFDFEETLYEAASGSSDVDAYYDDLSDQCYLDVSCDGDYVNSETEHPSYFGNWDVQEALYSFNCVRSVTCSDGSTFEDFGNHDIYYTTSSCYEDGTDSNGDPIMMQKCYTVVNCNGETVVGEGEEEYEIPCGAPCPGGLYRASSSIGLFDSEQAPQELTLAGQTNCRVAYTLQNSNRQRRLSINTSAASSELRSLAVIELNTGRVLRHFPFERLQGQDQALLQVNLPNTGIYVLSTHEKDGSVCASKVFVP